MRRLNNSKSELLGMVDIGNTYLCCRNCRRYKTEISVLSRLRKNA